MADRWFIRFGEFPAGRSKLWTAPTAYHLHQVGGELPGISVYEVEQVGEKYEICTDNLNCGSGYASLSNLLYRHSQNDDLPLSLMKARPLRWCDLSKNEQLEFEDHWPGRGRSKLELQGTDGEPLLRHYEIVEAKISVWDLTCAVHNFPDEFIESSKFPDEFESPTP